MSDEHIEKHWLTTKEAANRLGVNQRTLYRLIDEGTVPAYKLGKLMRLKAHEVDEALESARVERGELKHLYEPAPKEEG